MNAIQKQEADKLALIRRTVAKDCTDDEFRLFIHICNATRLDPLRRQAHAFVFGKKDPQKRQLTVVTSIGGYRAIADRTGNYRPDDDEPQFTMGEKDEKTNPKGIVSCKVKVFKFSHGEWWPAPGVARWEEYVPLFNGEIDKTKQGWIKMPFIMLAKCAEANALRKAWPDDFANVHAEEETHREASLDAVEATEISEREDRLSRIGGPSLIVDWMNDNALASVKTDDFFGLTMDFLRSCEEAPRTVEAWRDRNRETLKQFWGIKPAEALELKKELETAVSRISDETPEEKFLAAG